jgi:outer membrane lipoprotein SlyB
MIKNILISSAVIGLLLSGCAKSGVPEYDGRSYNKIKRFDVGTVVSQRAVIIKDSGGGSFLGAIIGAVVGSTLGGGVGRTFTTLGGGIAGKYAGEEIAKANATELSVSLENGENIVVVAKGKEFSIGDRVRIIKDGNRVAQVDKIE